MSEKLSLPMELIKADMEETLANPPRERWRGDGWTGFNIISLGAWLEVVRNASIPHIPATLISAINVDDLLPFADGIKFEDAPPSIQTFFGDTVEAAKDAGQYMPRLDCCATLEVKCALSDGLYEWSDDFYKFDLDIRSYDILYEFPGDTIASWIRPWMKARISNGYPVEYRVFVACGKIIGISNYYPQRSLDPASPFVQDDILEAVELTERLIKEVPTPLLYPGGREGFETGSKSFTVDFMRLEGSDGNGPLVFLEAGPPFGAGAHPCCFENHDWPWTEPMPYGNLDFPVALETTDPEPEDATWSRGQHGVMHIRKE